MPGDNKWKSNSSGNTDVLRLHRNLKVLGRATTSFVFEEDDRTVLMLSRDRVKSAWLLDSGLTTEASNAFHTTGHHIPGMDDFPVYCLRMPKLYPLEGDNFRIVHAAYEENVDVHVRLLMKHATVPGFTEDMALADYFKDGMTRCNLRAVMSGFYDYYRQRPDRLFHPVVMWIRRFDALEFSYDLHCPNVMQTRDGDIVVVDPVFSAELKRTVVRFRNSRQNALKAA